MDDSPNPRCLFVPDPEPDEDLSAPPTDGVQYLRRVIEQAKECEAVTRAEFNSPQRHNQLPQMPELKKCRSELLPDKAWELSTVADFSKLRLEMEARRNEICNDPTFIELQKSLPRKDDDEDWLELVTTQVGTVGPSTKLCLAMSQMRIWHVLRHLSEWLSNGEVKLRDGCRWVYCLLACLELPFEPDIYFTLRQIARTLINHRAQLESKDVEELPHINLIICLVTRYFSQADLADDL